MDRVRARRRRPVGEMPSRHLDEGAPSENRDNREVMMETKARKKKMRMEMEMASMVCRLRSEQAMWAGRLGPAGPQKLTWSPWGVRAVARSSRRTRNPWNDSFDAPSDGGPSLVFFCATKLYNINLFIY